MANKALFASTLGRLLPRAETRNHEGAPAYAYAPEHELAQLACTGTLGDTFYQSAEAELARVVALAEAVEPRFLAQAAIHGRQAGHMKDVPAVLLAVLARRDPVLFCAAFGRVVDSGRMLRTFVQVVRSGQTGRRSLGTAPKAMVRRWLEEASDRAILQAAIGNDPSLRDVLRMVHPKPATPERAALYGWVLGRPHDVALLPEALRRYLLFRETGQGEVPDVPFQMLAGLPLSGAQWGEIARTGSWQMVRQGLNTFLRHGAFEDPDVVEAVAQKLADPERIARAKAMPYQAMVAARNVSPEMPAPIREALHAAMEASASNVPRFAGRVAVCPDVSGSMRSPVTGWRKGATTAVRIVDVAALVAASVLRSDPSARVLPFDFDVREDVRLEARDTILTNADRLAALCGGGTNCSAPLAWLNARREAPDLVILVSDNESWVDAGRASGATATLAEWERLRRRNPRARLVCLDIAPYGTSQAAGRPDVLNVGGFSDAVWERIAAFARGDHGPGAWTRAVARVEI